ncbi:unnamed protein product [Trifolium pratense]|uniref:Uncharacterized protein n=1 Tax=Trifolium pratense TaxID=57577 RepID=A0ACB0JQH4_TRIPR|nr:unnamed protein product [Trifolium pratense]
MDKLNTSSNTSSTSWLSNMLFEEIDIEGCGDLFQQCEQNLFGDEEFLTHDIASVLQQDEILLEQSESYSMERPNKKLKPNTILQDVSPVSSPSSTTSQILSFDCTLNTTKQNEVVPLSSQKHVQLPQNRGSKRSVAHNQDHIIAERKRREKLSQCLIALAALIPGLKKMDKASVLGDAVKYVKELQERLKVLEEKNKNSNSTSPVECVVTMNNGPQLSYDSSSNDESEAEAGSGNNEVLEPHVDARILDKDVLIRIHCKKQKGLLLKVLFEIQKLNLFVVNSSVLPFGDSILDITIVAQMGTGYKLTRNGLIKSLRVAALRYMS